MKHLLVKKSNKMSFVRIFCSANNTNIFQAKQGKVAAIAGRAGRDGFPSASWRFRAYIPCKT